MVLLVTSLFTSASGIHFLHASSSEYLESRIPINRSQSLMHYVLNDIHNWVGVLMIVIIIIHLISHWNWIEQMTNRLADELMNKCKCTNKNGKLNLVMDLILGVSFILTAVSGIYLLFKGFDGGQEINSVFLFARPTWIFLHSWAGFIMVISAGIHLCFHWSWIVKVSSKMLRSINHDQRKIQNTESTIN